MQGVKTVAATLRPTQGHLHGAFGVVPVRRVWRTFIEDHHDIGAEIVLNLHGFFRIEEDWIAVDRVTEVYALLSDLTDIAQAEDLETAGVGEDGAFPLHEVVQIAVELHDLLAWAQPQVEGVAEDNLCASGFNFFRRHSFYGAVRAHRHKRGGFYHAAIKHQTTATRATIGGIEFKFHFFSDVRKTVQRCNTVPRTYSPTRSFKACGLYVINIASP